MRHVSRGGDFPIGTGGRGGGGISPPPRVSEGGAPTSCGAGPSLLLYTWVTSRGLEILRKMYSTSYLKPIRDNRDVLAIKKPIRRGACVAHLEDI